MSLQHCSDYDGKIHSWTSLKDGVRAIWSYQQDRPWVRSLEELTEVHRMTSEKSQSYVLYRITWTSAFLRAHISSSHSNVMLHFKLLLVFNYKSSTHGSSFPIQWLPPRARTHSPSAAETAAEWRHTVCLGYQLGLKGWKHAFLCAHLQTCKNVSGGQISGSDYWISAVLLKFASTFWKGCSSLCAINLFLLLVVNHFSSCTPAKWKWYLVLFCISMFFSWSSIFFYLFFQSLIYNLNRQKDRELPPLVHSLNVCNNQD